MTQYNPSPHVSRQALLANPKPADAITDMLYYMRMNSVFYTRSELLGPWGVEIPAIPQTLLFHLLVSGECVLDVEGKSHTMTEGEFVLLPHGNGHVIRSSSAKKAEPLFDLPLQAISEHYDVLNINEMGDGVNSASAAGKDNTQPTILLCAAVRFSDPVTTRVTQQMPSFLPVIPTEQEQTLFHTLKLLAGEAQRDAAGASAVISRLADVLIIQSIRFWLSQQSNPQGWVAAWQDKQIGKALRLLHEHPAKDWTLADLASESAMSRTRFAEQFKLLTGTPPLSYLAECRVSNAIEQLKHSSATILEIALSVGYQSESAFSRAFKKATGQSPRSVRQSGLAFLDFPS